MLDPSEGETEEPSHLGRWRQPKEAVEPQAAVEEDRIYEHKPQRDVMPTAIPRAGALQGEVPLHQRQPGAHSARGVEALQASMVSDDELEAEYQETVALKTFVKQRRAGKPQSPGDHKVELDKLEQKLPCAQGGRLGHGKDGHHCLAKVKRVSWAGGSNKLGGELCTVGCVLRFRNLTNLKPSSESFSYNLGLENSTCIADMFLYVPNLDGSVVSDCGDTRPASGPPGYVLGVGDTQPMLFCWSECSRSGTQPVRTPLALSAPNIDSVENVCIYRAEEGCCVVSDAQGPPIEGGQSVWTCMTNNSLIDDGFTAGEPRVCANLSLGVSIRSEFDGSEGIADTV